MAVHVKIPTPLRKFTEGNERVEVVGENVGALLEEMERRFPGIRERLCDDQGKVRRFVNLYLNGDDVKFLGGLATKLADGDEIAIVPAIAGGRS